MRNRFTRLIAARCQARGFIRGFRWARRLAVCAVAFVAIITITFHASVALSRYPDGIDRLPSDATLITDAAGNPLAEFVAPDGQWRTTRSHDEISPHLLAAVVAVEDARFFDHAGVDWKAAAAAAWQDLTALRMKRGASTITMQLHRLREPVPHTLAGKLEQAVRAAQIERSHSKQQILVEDLNRAPFGGNLVGAGAASPARPAA